MPANKYIIPELPLPYDLETRAVLKQLNRANKKLAELKGVALTIPNESILISTLTLQEAKDSSSVENIVTTQDDLFKEDLEIQDQLSNAAAKEVLNYRRALQAGFDLVKKHKLLTCNTIQAIQSELEANKAGFRTIPGTCLKDSQGKVVYTPPQEYDEIVKLMSNLEKFINDETISDIDPLIKLAIVHHQFESIHPFFDGNGRTGRIINILMLVTNDLLDLPILYLSRFITHNKERYYRLIQAIRDKEGDNSREWEEWILFMLEGIEETSENTILLIKSISVLMTKFKIRLKQLLGNKYKHDLLNNLFRHPYTKIEYVEKDMLVTRQTASKYLDKIVKDGLLTKMKLGKDNYYINNDLFRLFINQGYVKKQSELLKFRI